MAQSKSSKGQLFSMDIFMAVTLAMLMATMLVTQWNSTANEINTRQDQLDMRRAAFDATSSMLRIELVNQSNILDPVKTADFVLSPYNLSRNQVGLEGYEFYFRVVDTNDQVLYYLSTPLNTSADYSNATNIVVVRRIATLYDNPAIMYLYVWRGR
ncbi:MAG: hypothetical protein ABIG20_03340 [archaeon]